MKETQKLETVPETEVDVYNYKRKNGIIGWMDCGGSNVVKINEQLPNVVKLIATTTTEEKGSNAIERSRQLNVPLAFFDFKKYEQEQGLFPGDYYNALKIDEINHLLEFAGPKEIDALEYEKANIKKIKSKKSVEQILQVRKDMCNYFQEEINNKIKEYGLSENMPIFAAGGMALLSDEFVNNFAIWNVHPGDLTKYEIKGLYRQNRVIVGDAWKPSAKALSAGHEKLYSSIHLMIPEMDAGPVFMRGYALPIDYNVLESKIDIKDKVQRKAVAEEAQEILKHLGDHVIAGATFMDIFNSRWGKQKGTNDLVYKNQEEWQKVPVGIMPKTHEINNLYSSPFARTPKFIEEKVEQFYDKVDLISKT